MSWPKKKLSEIAQINPRRTQHEREDDLSEDRGGNQANLNGALLKALEVPAPSKTEQQHMVARIQAAMTEIDALENSSKAALADINRLPNRVLAQAFDSQRDHHD